MFCGHNSIKSKEDEKKKAVSEMNQERKRRRRRRRRESEKGVKLLSSTPGCTKQTNKQIHNKIIYAIKPNAGYRFSLRKLILIEHPS